MIDRVQQLDWLTLLIATALIFAVLRAPFDLLNIVQRRWEERQRQRIARGEDVTPKRIHYNDEDEDG